MIERHAAVAETSDVVRGEQPLVSVIMNCFNGERYLRPAIDSVIAQSYPHWELIFWDNQSTDRSAEIVKSYRDSRIQYYYAPTHTVLYEARNRALGRASGELIAFLDVDDAWLPHKLEKQVPLFADREVGFVYGKFWIENEQKKSRRVFPTGDAPAGWVSNELLQHYFIGMMTLIIRRSALESLSRAFDSRWHLIGDFDLAIRLSTRWRSACVQEPIALNRLHGDNETAKHSRRQIAELDCWVREMREAKEIDAVPSAGFFFDQQFPYRKALDFVLAGDRGLAFDVFRTMPWGRFKLKLMVLLCLPTGLARHLRG